MKFSVSADTTAAPPAAARDTGSRCRRRARKVKNALKDAAATVAVRLAEGAEGRKSNKRRGRSAGGGAPMVVVELRCDDDEGCAGAMIADCVAGLFRGAAEHAGECASALLDKLSTVFDTSCGDCDFNFGY